MFCIVQQRRAFVFYKCDVVFTRSARSLARSLFYFIFLLELNFMPMYYCYRKVAVVVALLSLSSPSSSNYSSRDVAFGLNKNIIVFEFVQQPERGCVKSVSDDWFALVVDKETNYAPQVCV